MPMCKNCHADDMPTYCKGRTDSVEQEYCEPCRKYNAEMLEARRERARRERALQDCFDRHADDIARACADRTAEIETQTDITAVETCEKCKRDILNCEQAEMVGDRLMCTRCAQKENVHDDCPICLENEPNGGSWTKLDCGHEMCVQCYAQCQANIQTSEMVDDYMVLGHHCRNVKCPMCRAVDGCSSVPELRRRIECYKAKVATERTRHQAENNRILTQLNNSVLEAGTAKTHQREAERQAMADRQRVLEKDREIADLKRQIAEMSDKAYRPPQKNCPLCNNANHERNAPYCHACMCQNFGDDWMEQQQRIRPEEPVIVRQRYGPDTIVHAGGGGGGGGVKVGGGGGGVQRRPCRNPDCETPKPTQRRCPHHEDTPCCKRCDRCRVCKGQ